MGMIEMDMNPGYFNRYAYTMNDPINLIDPDGEQASSVVPRLKPPAPVPVKTGQSLTNPIQGGATRGCDSKGCGNFGASRGARSHKGVDVTAAPGDSVRAPISGEVRNVTAIYKNDKPDFDGVEITDTKSNESVKIFYVDSAVANGDTVSQGDTIGTTQDLTKVYPGITNHVHVEHKVGGVKVDPTPFKPDTIPVP